MTISGSSSSLVVPMVMWGRHPPVHCISAIYLLRDQKTLVSGSSDGQVFLWEVNAQSDKWEMTPRHVLVGHTSPIKCIAKASGGADGHHIVTSSENGEMFCWDTEDGRCIENKRLSTLIHTHIQAYRSPDTQASGASCTNSASSGVKLFCCGFYPEIVVMDPFTLTVKFQLSSRISPDWVASFHVLRPRNRNDDVVLALTTTGTVKVWTLNGDEHLNTDPILENESKQIRCINAVSMTCCVYNMRTVLIVCATYWAIYDAGDFTCLLKVDCARGERWIGGEFISAERVAVWSDDGRAYLYRMPTNCIVESKDFHNKSKMPSTVSSNSLLFCQLVMDRPDGKRGRDPLDCPPAFRYLIFSKDNKWVKYLMRGDANGRLAVWKIPDTPQCASMQLKRQETSVHQQEMGCEGVTEQQPIVSTNIEEIWAKIRPPPPGALSQLDEPIVEDVPKTKNPFLPSEAISLTATIFLPMQCKLVCGRDDGSIIMVPATHTIMLQLLSGRHQKFQNWPQHQILLGHTGKVNCLLYPNNEHPRYDVAHLISGSIDFSVCLWDIYTGTLLHRFCAHAGEIANLYIPPANCSPRIQQCICSVASDHSVTLLSLKERRCVMLASRHMFPIATIKWRPLDDFLMIGCVDGTTYIWQMETGHLDRVVHGNSGEEILAACDEHTATINVGDNVGANPALHFFRGLRHRNLAAIKLATMSQLQGKQGPLDQIQEKSRAFPLNVSGFKMNPRDSEGHILFFDIEALVIQLLTEEYSVMSPGTMEAQGFTNQREYDRIWALTKPASPDTVRKISGFLNKVKDTADNRINSISQGASPDTQRRMTGFMAKVKDTAEKAKGELEIAKREIEKRAGALDEEANSRKDSDGSISGRPSSLHLEINLTLEIGQLLLSLLHAWGLDKDLDKVATNKLGLLRPKVPVSYGILSKGGVMSLMLPTWYPRLKASNGNENILNELKNPQTPLNNVSESMPAQEVDTTYFTALGHWELSNTITTNHLLSVIAITNTLVSVSNASFIPEQERKRKLVRQATHGAMELPNANDSSAFSHQQEQIKQGWSLLSTLHCLLLSGKLKRFGSLAFKKPQVELLAIRWQDRCLQIRLAAQELLVAELKNLGVKGRRQLVERWGSYLPKYGDPPFQQAPGIPANNTASGTQLQNGVTVNGNAANGTNSQSEGDDDTDIEDDLEEDEENSNSGAVESRRNQTTAVILLGVIGALFDLEAEKEGAGDNALALGMHMTRLTAKALMYLVLCSSPSSGFFNPGQQTSNSTAANTQNSNNTPSINSTGSNKHINSTVNTNTHAGHANSSAQIASTGQSTAGMNGPSSKNIQIKQAGAKSSLRRAAIGRSYFKPN